MNVERSRWAPATSGVAAGLDVATLYAANYSRMVRVAAFLLGSAAQAEDVAQDAFVKIASSRLEDPDKAIAYLHRIVLNACRSAHRHREVVDRHARTLRVVENAPSAEESAWTAFDRTDLVVALRALSPRKRQVVVLRHYCDMSERAVSDLLGISVGAVKSTTARALADLAKALECP